MCVYPTPLAALAKATATTCSSLSVHHSSLIMGLMALAPLPDAECVRPMLLPMLFGDRWE